MIRYHKKIISYNSGGLNTWFSWKKLSISLIIAMIVGGIAGVLGVIGLFGQEITKEFIMTVLGAGYAGTDFIEGFIKKQWETGFKPRVSTDTIGTTQPTTTS